MKKLFVSKAVCLLTVVLISTVAVYAAPDYVPEPQCQPYIIMPLDKFPPPGGGGGSGGGGND